MGKMEVVMGCLEYNTQLLYFTSSSLSINDEKLFTISDRSGHPNIYMKDLKTGEEVKITDNREGYLKSYVYFDGQQGKGIGKASISLDAANNIIYFIQDNHIHCVGEDGKIILLADIPEDQVTAFTHVSADGSRLCVPTTDARALEYEVAENNRPPFSVDKRIKDEGLNSYIHVFDTKTGEKLLCEKVPKAWVTHVQFCPANHNLILYNHEWPDADSGICRMWLFDGEKHIRLRDEEQGRSREDWTCHEMWSECGKYIIYHGGYRNNIPYVGRLTLGDGSIIEIALPEQYQQYGHFTISKYGDLVSDGYYRELSQEGYQNVNDSWAGQYISLQKVDWENETIEWIPLCKHFSSWVSQDAHPHPIFNHHSDKVYFTSDVSGRLRIYSVCVREEGHNMEE